MDSVFSTARFDLYRNGEAIQLAHDVVKACTDAGAATLKIDVATNALDAVCNAADAAYGINAGSTLTEEVIALDHLRDEGIVAIKLIATGWAKHKDATKRAAAKLIVNSLNKFGTTISRENLATETTIIRNWYADVQSSPDLKAALTLLSIKEWADDVNTDNEAFNAKYVLRSQQVGDAQNLETVGDILPELQKKFKNLMHIIDALNLLDTTKAYAALINKVNGLIKQYNDRAKARKATAAKGATDSNAGK